MSLLPQTIADRYVVKEIIGTGGMGQVLRAHDPHLAIDVAIKLLHKNDIDTTAARLQREAVAAGKLNHKNIARVYNFGQTADGEPYMVMEFVQGITLSDLIKKESHLPVKQAIEIFIQICSGLQLAHANGIVHRDLKPSNIMLSQNSQKGLEEAKILDFGVAKLEQASQKLTSTSAIIGSPLYMSPEQASALEIDSRSDIYSLGCLMFETLTGIVPLKGKSALETISLHRGKAPPLISDVIEHFEFPEKLIELVNKCLAKLPEQRPSSAQEIIVELNNIQTELAQKMLAKPDTVPNHRYIPKTTFKQLAIILLGVGVCGLTIFSFAKWIFDIQDNSRKSFDKKLDQSQKYEKNSNVTADSIRSAVGTRSTQFYNAASGGKGIWFRKFIIDYGLKTVEDFPELREIKLNDCMLLKGPGLKYLTNTKINRVYMQRSKIDEENLKYLGAMKTLTALELTSDRLTDRGVALIVQNKNLAELMLGSDLLTDHTAELIATLPKIEKVELNSKLLTDKSVDFLKHKKLRYLCLVNTNVSENVGVKIAKIPNIEVVVLNGTKKLSLKSLDALSNARIKYLGVADVPLSKEHFKEIAKNKSLSEFTFRAYPGCHKDLEVLTSIKQPLDLNLPKNNYIDDKLIDVITRLPIVKLDLDKTNLTDKQLINLAKIKSLKRLKVQDCPFVTVYGEEGFHRFFKLMWKHDCKLELKMDPSVVGLTEQLRPVEEYRENERLQNKAN